MDIVDQKSEQSTESYIVDPTPWINDVSVCFRGVENIIVPKFSFSLDILNISSQLNNALLLIKISSENLFDED